MGRKALERECDAMCQDTPPTIVSLLPGEAPREAREVARAALCRGHAAAADAAVELIASELVTDSVRHGVPPIELSVDCRVADVQITVVDGGSWRPRPDAVGRDLAWVLVDKIARDWGVEVTATGRRLWCSVPSGSVPEAADGAVRRHRVIEIGSR
jgi:hypothetical protein